MTNRARERLARGERNLEQAAASETRGRRERACFAAQRAGEALERRSNGWDPNGLRVPS